jgi:hypothetical protein
MLLEWVSMAFHFQCPQGHVLQGDESLAGQQCQCPTCGTLFIVPAPVVVPIQAVPVQAAPSQATFVPAHAAYLQAQSAPPQSMPPQAAAAPTTPAFSFGQEKLATAPAFIPGKPSEPELLHIPCPNGHELETPVEMLDQEVLCPTCNSQFRLRRRDSVEFKRKKEIEEKLRLEKVGNLWLNWAIAAVVLVAIGLVALVVLSQLNEPIGPKPGTTESPRAPAE